MSVASTAPITGYDAPASQDRAEGREAKALRKLLEDAAAFMGSMSVGEPKQNAQIALASVYMAARVNDWDHSGAIRVEPSTCAYADHFLRLLPSSLPLPEIMADVDGELLLEWDRGRRNVFSVSVGRDGTLTFSGLFGYTKIHGTKHFGQAIPSTIMECIRRVLAPTAR